MSAAGSILKLHSYTDLCAVCIGKDGVFMPTAFYRHPNLLLDAEELIYACVNDKPAESLTKDAPYCVPLPQVEQMMADVRELVPPSEDRERFFRSYQLPKCSPGSHTCLARLMTYTFFDCAAPDTDAALRSLAEAWNPERAARQREVFVEVQAFGLTLARQEEGELPFALGLGRLPLPTGLREDLLEMFSDYIGSVRTLSRLLRPVMQYLEDALVPYMKRALPFIESWEKKMEGLAPEDFALEYIHYRSPHPIEHLTLSVMFFNPEWVVCRLVGDNDLCIALGVGEPWNASPDDFAPWEYRALRLLGSPARVRMLRALEQQPMSSREMAKALDLHLGAVTRDVSSMYEEQLLNVELQGSRRRYSVNHKALETIIQHLQAVIKPDTAE